MDFEQIVAKYLVERYQTHLGLLLNKLNKCYINCKIIGILHLREIRSSKQNKSQIAILLKNTFSSATSYITHRQ